MICKPDRGQDQIDRSSSSAILQGSDWNLMDARGAERERGCEHR
jgi:hypothetical protein